MLYVASVSRVGAARGRRRRWSPRAQRSPREREKRSGRYRRRRAQSCIHGHGSRRGARSYLHGQAAAHGARGKAEHEAASMGRQQAQKHEATSIGALMASLLKHRRRVAQVSEQTLDDRALVSLFQKKTSPCTFTERG
jgi:hypothetical protein